MENRFLKVMPALALAFTLALAGCGGPQEVIGDVGIDGPVVIKDPVEITLPETSSPEVTDKLLNGCVQLNWNPVIDAAGYEVWRSASGQPATLIASGLQPKPNGGYEYYDLVSTTNKLISSTPYTYTVKAIPYSGSKEIAQWEKAITTGTIPAQGSQIASPTVKLTVDADKKSVSVTITPPATGNIPDRYELVVEKQSGGGNNLNGMIYPDTLTWTLFADEYENYGNARTLYSWLNNNPAGKYIATVTARLGSTSSGVPPYFTNAEPATDEVIIEPKEPLFGQGYNYFTPSATEITNTAGDTVTGFYATISLNNIRPLYGVTYTVERAVYDDDEGELGDYAPVTIYEDLTTATAGTLFADVDIFGNYSVSTVYDRSLPVTEARYRYRIKATKSAETDYLEANSYINVSFYWLLNISLTVDARTDDGTNSTYEVTPWVQYKGLLQTNDKVVLYQVIGGNNSYRTGPYEAAGVSFTKAELEAGTPKALTVAQNGTGTDYKYLYVQAYLERADETKVNFDQWSNFSWDYYNSGGINTIYNNNGQNHAYLNY